MAVIFHVMKEEYERLIEAEKVYRGNIKKMPQGSVRIKHFRNREYLYLARRRGTKVVYDYIGAADSQEAKDILERIKQRKRYQGFLKDIRRDLKEVKKALRGKI